MGGAENHLPRRAFLTGAASLSGTLALSQETGVFDAVEAETESSETALRNISSFRMLDWRPYFDTLKNGAILSDIDSRALHYWSEDCRSTSYTQHLFR